VSLKNILLGKPKDPLDPGVFHQVSIVGLGADGLAHRPTDRRGLFALGDHFFLALPLAVLIATTVFVTGKL
jgi:hypothetical protein